MLKQTIKRFLQRRAYPKRVTVTDFDPGGVRFEVSNSTEEYRARKHGGETEYISRMLGMLREEDVLYDIGACIGLVTLHAIKKCSVVSFEPDPYFRDRIFHNARLNGYVEELQALPVAISEKDAMVTLHTEGLEGNSPSLRRQRDESHSIEVEARSIDSLVAAGLRPPTVLKIDIEGAEMLALRGAKDLFTGSAPPRLIFLELHPEFLPAFGSSSDEVMGLLTEYRYEIIKRDERADEEHLILQRMSGE